MTAIYKRKDRKSWVISYFDHKGRRITKSSRTTDRRVAERIAAKWEADVALRREGVVDARADAYAQAERKPITQHIQTFEDSFIAKGNTTGHVKETMENIRRIVALCNAERLSDLTAPVVQKAIATIREKGSSLRTCNKVLRSMKTFLNWFQKEKYLRENPLSHLSFFNTQTDKRHTRRDLLEDELGFLIFHTSKSSIRLGLSGEDRAMLYRLAAGSGLRARELSSLFPESFNLKQSPPTVTVKAAYSKHRKEDIQPLSKSLAAQLEPWIDKKFPKQHVFPFKEKKTSKMIREDLKAARETWIKEARTKKELEGRQESDFLCYEDKGGRFADFHSLRHTYITNLVKSGANPKVAQELARHASPLLTLGIYSHVRLHDLSKALEAVPIIEGPNKDNIWVAATGTTGMERQQKRQQSVHETVQNDAKVCDEKNQKENPDEKKLGGKFMVPAKLNHAMRKSARKSNGEGDGTRTRNIRIDSPVL